MTTNEYVPSEDLVIEAWKRYSGAQDAKHARLSDGDAGDEAQRFLARVRRDAARDAEARIEAVQHLIDQADEMGEWAITCTRLQWAIDGSNPQPSA